MKDYEIDPCFPCLTKTSNLYFLQLSNTDKDDTLSIYM